MTNNLAAKQQTEQRVSPLPRNRRQHAEHAMARHEIIVPVGVSKESALDPNFYANVAQVFKQHDEVRLRWEDGSRMVWGLVSNVTAFTVTILELNELKMQENAEQVLEVDGFSLKWNGPTHKWVVLDQNKRIVSKEHSSRDAALKWLSSHQKAIAK